MKSDSWEEWFWELEIKKKSQKMLLSLNGIGN